MANKYARQPKKSGNGKSVTYIQFSEDEEAYATVVAARAVLDVKAFVGDCLKHKDKIIAVLEKLE